MIHEGVDTPKEANMRRSERQAIGTIRKASPEKRAQVARELLDDPDVTSDSEVSMKIRRHPGRA